MILYDTKGIELGDESFINATRDFIDERRAMEIEKQIHCVWYVISLDHGRFQDFEIKVCQEVRKVFFFFSYLFIYHKIFGGLSKVLGQSILKGL